MGLEGRMTEQSGEIGSAEKRVPVLYLDLDGTVREGKDDPLNKFVNGPEDVRVFPEAVEMMRRWKAGGGRITGVSNQGGIALGIVTEEKVAAAMVETQRQVDGLFDQILWCHHHPDAEDPEWAQCWCRKPSAGAVVEAAHGLVARFPGEIYPPYMGLFVGDRPEDEACAKSAGLDFQWAADWRAQAFQSITGHGTTTLDVTGGGFTNNVLVVGDSLLEGYGVTDDTGGDAPRDAFGEESQ
jgi:D-glycero-D-manno-heptose 1,7-bisphosphate phosphatase